MVRWVFLIAVSVVLGACTSAAAPAASTEAPLATTTTTTLTPGGLRVSPALITEAVLSGAVDAVEGDRLMVMAMFSDDPGPIPPAFLVAGDLPSSRAWDHAALTRLLDRWDELSGPLRFELSGAVDGLAEMVGPTPTAPGRGCLPVTGTNARVCPGDSLGRMAPHVTPVQAAAGVVRPWVHGAVERAWSSYERLFENSPTLVEVVLADLTAPGSFAYRATPATEEGPSADICRVYVDVFEEPATSDVVPGDGPIGVPPPDRIKATVAHQLFHCFVGSTFPKFDQPFLEGVATWAEYHVYPAGDVAPGWLTTWISDPARPFDERTYDTAFAFLYADRRGGGPDAVMAVLASNSIDRLDPMFGDLWHRISVAAWNEEPVEPFVVAGESIPGSVEGVTATEISAEAHGSLGFDLPLYSRSIQGIEFDGGTDTADLVAFASVELDLRDVPADVRITALPETTTGWMDPVPLEGSDWRFCRVRVGSCNDADTVAPYTRIVFIATNVDNGIERFDVSWTTVNPRLNGTWTRTRGPISTIDTSPFWIVGTELRFDEAASVMTEDAADSTFTHAEPGWTCVLSGGYSITADPLYNQGDGGEASGTITVSGPVAGDGFVTECVVAEDAILPSFTVPIFDAPDSTFGFEIVDYDTLWIYGDGRIYLYERVDG